MLRATSILSAIIAVVVFAQGCAPTMRSTTTSRDAPKVMNLSDLVDRVRSGVVRVTADDGLVESQGSGSIYSVDRQAGSATILTSEHLVRGAGKIVISIEGAPAYSASIVGTDPARDLALLSICCSPDFHPLLQANAGEIRLGEPVVALGYPLGFESLRVSQGIISGLQFDPSRTRYEIQTDAAVNPGNSGGPLLLMNGELVGVIARRASFTQDNLLIEGVGFAISIETARSVVEVIVQASAQSRSTPQVPTSMPLAMPPAIPTPTVTQASLATATGEGFRYTGKGPSQSPEFRLNESPWKIQYTASWTGLISLDIINEQGESKRVHHRVAAGKTYETFINGLTGTLHFKGNSVPREGEWTVSVLANPVVPTQLPSPGTVFRYTGNVWGSSPPFTINSSPWTVRFKTSFTGNVNVYASDEIKTCFLSEADIIIIPPGFSAVPRLVEKAGGKWFLCDNTRILIRHGPVTAGVVYKTVVRDHTGSLYFTYESESAEGGDEWTVAVVAQ